MHHLALDDEGEIEMRALLDAPEQGLAQFRPNENRADRLVLIAHRHGGQEQELTRTGPEAERGDRVDLAEGLAQDLVAEIVAEPAGIMAAGHDNSPLVGERQCADGAVDTFEMGQHVERQDGAL